MKVAVVGAGVSGLTLSHYLCKNPLVKQVKLFEQATKTGGWISSNKRPLGHIFEAGPHSVRPAGQQGLAVLNLFKELDVLKTCVPANETIKIRYVYHDRKLNALPSTTSDLTRLVTDKFLRPLISATMRDLAGSNSFKQRKSDTSVFEFFESHFGAYTASVLADSMVAGIYAGNSRKLSMETCFKPIYDIERSHGSIFKGGLLANSNPIDGLSQFPKSLTKSSALSFPAGLQTLTDALESELRRSEKCALHLDHKITSIEGGLDTIKLHQGTTSEDFDHVFYSSSAKSLQSILPEAIREVREVQEFNAQLRFNSVATINLAFKEGPLNPFPIPGFGHLVPEVSRIHGVLGMLYDSNVFPMQFENGYTGVTVMMGGALNPETLDMSEAELLDCALRCIKTQLFGDKISIDEVKTSIVDHAVTYNRDAIPEYFVGFQQARDSYVGAICTKLPRLKLLGTNVHAVGIAANIENAKNVAVELC